MVAPYTAADAKGLLKAAIRDPNPVIFLENEMLYGHTGEVPKLDDFVLPIGKARIVRTGRDVTIVSWSIGMTYALKAADELAKEGIEAEVIDLRTLRPMDTETVIASVKKTGRAVTVEEGWPQSGVGAEIAARIMEHAFDYLDAPVARVTGKDVPMPYAANLEKLALPTVAEVVEAVKAVCVPVDPWRVPRNSHCRPTSSAARTRSRSCARSCVDGGLSIAFQRAFEEPDMWGLLLVDIARHAARAYARETEYTEDEALTRIVDMFEAEINRPTDAGTTTPRVATRSLTMPINILMPALSPTMEKGNLAKWLKKEGDKVKSGDVIAEIETDKATMEVEAVDEGTIAKIVVPEGTQDVTVNAVIAVLAGEGEDVKAAGAAPAPAPKAAAAPRRATGARSGACRRRSCAEARCRRSAACSARGGCTGRASQWPRPRIRVAAGPSPRQGSRHRDRPHHRLRPAWPRRRARRRGRQVGQGPRRRRPPHRLRRRRACARAGDGGRADPDAVRTGLLRARAA